MSEDVDHPLAAFGVSPRSLRQQVSLLRRLGFRALTLRELIAAFETDATIGRAVVLTFDDGYRDTVTTAAPILDEVGFRATAFVVTDLVGQAARWDEGRGPALPLATWDQLRMLRARDWEIGLHTATHPDLTMLPDQALRNEIDGAKRSLQRALGERVETFAYPYGACSPHVLRVVQRAGFRAAVTASAYAMAGQRSPRFALPRCWMKRGDRLIDLLFLLTLGCRPAELDALFRQPAAPLRPGR